MIKKIGILTACIALLITGSMFFMKNSYIKPLTIPKMGAHSPHIEYKYKVTNREDVDKAKVYKYVKPQNALKEANEIAKKLGIQGKVEKFENMNIYSIKSDAGNLEYWYDTGKWQYESSDSGDITGGNVPNEEECIKIAKDYMHSIGMDIPERFQEKVVLTEASSGDEFKGDYRLIHRGVNFYPLIDGKEVYGVSRITIRVGPFGKILGIDKFYKDFVDDGIYDIINADTALKLLETDDASLSIDLEATEAEVQSIRIHYWEDAGSYDEQPHLQPVWVIGGKSINKKGEAKEFDAVIPALKKNAKKIK